MNMLRCYTIEKARGVVPGIRFVRGCQTGGGFRPASKEGAEWRIRTGSGLQTIEEAALRRCIIVGEPGRGRVEVAVPVPTGAVMEGDIVVEVPNTKGHGQGACLILIRDRSGFRGGWAPRQPLTVAARTSIRAAIADGQNPPIPPAPEWAAENHPRCVAKGWCAQGDAGRAGGGPVYLVLMLPDEQVDLCAWGRLYGGAAVWRLENRAGGPVLVDCESELASAVGVAKL